MYPEPNADEKVFHAYFHNKQTARLAWEIVMENPRPHQVSWLSTNGQHISITSAYADADEITCNWGDADIYDQIHYTWDRKTPFN